MGVLLILWLIRIVVVLDMEVNCGMVMIVEDINLDILIFVSCVFNLFMMVLLMVGFCDLFVNFGL